MVKESIYQTPIEITELHIRGVVLDVINRPINPGISVRMIQVHWVEKESTNSFTTAHSF